MAEPPESWLEHGRTNRPYALYDVPSGFEFTTDQGVKYFIDVDRDETHLGEVPFGDHLAIISLIPEVGPPNTRDPQIKQTLISAIRKVFKRDPQAILFYVCSLDDDQEEVRQYFFGKLFDRFGGDYHKLEFNYEESREFMAVIRRKDHPNLLIDDEIIGAIEGLY